MANICNLWREFDDIQDNWESLLRIVDFQVHPFHLIGYPNSSQIRLFSEGRAAALQVGSPWCMVRLSPFRSLIDHFANVVRTDDTGMIRTCWK